MVVGFLKGVWGKPAQKATGVQGIWSTVSNAPNKIIGKLTSPFKMIKYVITGIILIFAYKLYKKK